jgi:hypothetical protein
MVAKQSDYVFVSSTDDLQDYQSRDVGFVPKAPNLPNGTEDVSIRGAVPVPAASDFSESKKSLNEIVAQKGELAQVPNIDLCGFLPKVPNIDLPNLALPGLPSLGDIMAGINGITLGGVSLISGALEGVLGKLGDLNTGIGSAVQANIPNISCGAPIAQTIPQAVPPIGAALQPPSVPVVPSAAAVPSVDYGVTPEITVETTSLTVNSIDDELDAGEFT